MKKWQGRKERKTHYPLRVSGPAPSSVGVANVLSRRHERPPGGGAGGVESRAPPLPAATTPAATTPGHRHSRSGSFLLPDLALQQSSASVNYFLNVNSRSGQEAEDHLLSGKPSGQDR